MSDHGIDINTPILMANLGGVRGIKTGMIDTDITFNPISKSYFFVVDGETWSGFLTQGKAAEALRVVLERRRIRYEIEEIEEQRRQRTISKLSPETQERLEQQQGIPWEPDVAEVGSDCWSQIKQAYQDGEHAGYDPEEIAEILYDLVQQLMDEQGSD